MKIAIFTDIYTPCSSGGIVSAIQSQKAELERLGHEVTVFCPGFRTDDRDVVLVPSYKHLRINDTIIAKNTQIIEEFIEQKYPKLKGFDLVHVHHELFCSIAGVRLAKKYGIPLVQTMHGREDMAIAMNVPFGLRWLVAGCLRHGQSRLLPCDTRVKKDKFQAPTKARSAMWTIMVNHANQADVVTVPADHFAQKLEHYGVSKPILVVPNGLPDTMIETEFVARDFTDGDVLKMVWNSRVSNEKRFLTFLRAVGQLERPYMLYVYGDGNALKKAKRYAKKHQLKVRFYGTRPRQKITERMSESHLGVLTSYNFDTQGMVLIEAEATGMPVFFCDPCLIESVPAGGFVLSGGPDATAMALALESIQPKQIGEMSRIMLKNRKNTAQTVQMKKMLEAYRLAIESKKIARKPLAKSRGR